MNRLLLALLLLVGASNSVAQQRTAQIHGVGGDTCGEFTGQKQNLAAYEYIVISWVQGYMAGYNVFSKSAQVKQPSAETLKAFVSKYCEDNPLSTIAAMTDVLMARLRTQR